MTKEMLKEKIALQDQLSVLKLATVHFETTYTGSPLLRNNRIKCLSRLIF